MPRSDELLDALGVEDMFIVAAELDYFVFLLELNGTNHADIVTEDLSNCSFEPINNVHRLRPIDVLLLVVVICGLNQHAKEDHGNDE